MEIVFRLHVDRRRLWLEILEISLGLRHRQQTPCRQRNFRRIFHDCLSGNKNLLLNESLDLNFANNLNRLLDLNIPNSIYKLFYNFFDLLNNLDFNFNFDYMIQKRKKLPICSISTIFSTSIGTSTILSTITIFSTS